MIKKGFLNKKEQSTNVRLNPSKVWLGSIVEALPNPTKAQLTVSSIERYLSSIIIKKVLSIKKIKIKPVMFFSMINPKGGINLIF